MSLDFFSARAKALEIVKGVEKTSYCTSEKALGRVLAEDIYCIKNLPSYNNAALDGFALKSDDYAPTMKINSTIFAGQIVEPCLSEGECYKIMTGAKVPSDADTIIPFEMCEFAGDTVTFLSEPKKNNAFRFKGEECGVGEQLISKHTTLTPSHVTLLATQGITKVKVYNLPKIAIISTGDELKEAWERASEEQIYNCNSYSIEAILRTFGFFPEYCGVMPDNFESSVEFIRSLNQYDMIVSSGGISMGEADFVGKAFEECGFKATFHGINIKPGRPTMVGLMDEVVVVSLPGNPMAAFLNAYMLLVPMVKKLSNASKFLPESYYARLKNSFSCRGGRSDFVLGQYISGDFYITRGNKYGSGMVLPLVESNAFILTKEDEKFFGEDEIVEFYLLPQNS